MRISDKPQPAPCPSCGEDTLVAWRDGILEPVYVDPIRLTVLGELQALLTGRETFAHWGGPNGALDTRIATSIARWPAGKGRGHPIIRPQHRCGAAPPDHLPELHAAAHTDPPF